MFDITLQAFTYGVEPLPEQHALLYHFSVGIFLPPAPNSDQRGIIPLGMVKLPIGYNMAKEFEKEHAEALSQVDAPSKLQVVGDTHRAEAMAAAAAKMEADIRTGKPGNDAA